MDIAGLVEGASKGEGLGNKFLSHIRQVDAILQVVRAFDDSNVHHVTGSVNPLRDIEIINTELIIADLETLERRMGDNAKKGRSGDKDAAIRTPIYEALKNHLESGKLAVTLELDDEQKSHISDLFLLTNKPFIYAVNVAEDKLLTNEADLRAMTGISEKNIPVLPVSAKIEMEMLEFSEEDRTAFLADYGVTTNPMDVIISTCYHLLGLQYYFTAGEIEVRCMDDSSRMESSTSSRGDSYGFRKEIY